MTRTFTRCSRRPAVAPVMSASTWSKGTASVLRAITNTVSAAPSVASRKRPEPLPLFDITPEMIEPSEGEATKSTTRSVRQGKCPACMAPKTGLVASGVHLVWRAHSLTTWGGTPIACRTSGVAVCVAPERNPLVQHDPARCPHDRR